MVFLPPEGEVLVCLGGTLLRQVLNLLKFDDLHGHIIYQNDPMAKPDFMVMVPDLYRRRRRYQGRRRLPRHPPEPQGHFLGVYLIMYYDSTQLTKYTNLLHTLSTNTFRPCPTCRCLGQYFLK